MSDMTDTITLPREVVEAAVKALESANRHSDGDYTEKIKALRAHLAAPKQEPSDDRKAMKLALDFVTSKQWGTRPYMEYGVFTDAFVLAEALRTALAAPSEDIEALRRDAERYRWLRNRAWFQFEFEGRYGDSGETVQELDAAIDAAMGEKR